MNSVVGNFFEAVKFYVFFFRFESLNNNLFFKTNKISCQFNWISTMTRLEISIFITLRPSLLFYFSSIFTPQPTRLSLRKNLLKERKKAQKVFQSNVPISRESGKVKPRGPRLTLLTLSSLSSLHFPDIAYKTETSISFFILQ